MLTYSYAILGILRSLYLFYSRFLLLQIFYMVLPYSYGCLSTRAPLEMAVEGPILVLCREISKILVVQEVILGTCWFLTFPPKRTVLGTNFPFGLAFILLYRVITCKQFNNWRLYSWIRFTCKIICTINE